MKQNFTDEQVAILKAEYDPTASDSARRAQTDALAEKMGKTRASIVAKLSSMGIYVKKARQDKTGAPVTTKQELVNAIRIFSGARDHELASLEKASKQDLKVLLDVFKNLQNSYELKNS